MGALLIRLVPVGRLVRWLLDTGTENAACSEVRIIRATLGLEIDGVETALVKTCDLADCNVANGNLVPFARVR